MEKFTYYFIYQPIDQTNPTISFGGETTFTFETIVDIVKGLLPLNMGYVLVLSNYQKFKEDEPKKSEER